MKKSVFFWLLTVFCLLSVPAFAKSGDIAGQYYSTDIRTFLNGIEVDAINIGGRTLIGEADFSFNTFSLYWDKEMRQLDMIRTKHAQNGAPPVVERQPFPSGTPRGNYYETDIKTFLDGKEIEAYNLGGSTYVVAEEMAKFGYVVVWDGENRTLSVTSPDRAGYEYSIFLSQGQKADDPEDQGVGAFSILYWDGSLTGRGDAKRFSSHFSCDGTRYAVATAFYQNEGLFYASNLTNLLYQLSYDGNVENPCMPEDKYDLVNQYVTVTVNGQRAGKVSILRGQGNGHVDYTFFIEGLPLYKQEDIHEILIEVGHTEGLESFPITETLTEYQQQEKKRQAMMEALKTSGEDYIQTYYEGDGFLAVFLRQAIAWGTYRDRLYLMNVKTNAVSDDLLEQVRKYEGFDFNELSPFGFFVGTIPQNLFFSCNPPGRTGDFYVDTQTGEVHLLAENIR